MKKMIKAYIIYCLIVFALMIISYLTNIFHFSASTFIIGLVIGMGLSLYMEE